MQAPYLIILCLLCSDDEDYDLGVTLCSRTLFTLIKKLTHFSQPQLVDDDKFWDRLKDELYSVHLQNLIPDEAAPDDAQDDDGVKRDPDE